MTTDVQGLIKNAYHRPKKDAYTTEIYFFWDGYWGREDIIMGESVLLDVEALLRGAMTFYTRASLLLEENDEEMVGMNLPRPYDYCVWVHDHHEKQ